MYSFLSIHVVIPLELDQAIKNFLDWKFVEYLSNYLTRRKENMERRKRDKVNKERIIDVDTD